MLNIEVGKFKRDKTAILMYVIYDKPTDFPDDYIARAWEIGHSSSRPTRYMTRAASLEEIRQTLPPGLECLGRDAKDDPCIVEVWL